jgi:hypothetical protein
MQGSTCGGAVPGAIVEGPGGIVDIGGIVDMGGVVPALAQTPRLRSHAQPAVLMHVPSVDCLSQGVGACVPLVGMGGCVPLGGCVLMGGCVPFWGCVGWGVGAGVGMSVGGAAVALGVEELLGGSGIVTDMPRSIVRDIGGCVAFGVLFVGWGVGAGVGMGVGGAAVPLGVEELLGGSGIVTDMPRSIVRDMLDIGGCVAFGVLFVGTGVGAGGGVGAGVGTGGAPVAFDEFDELDAGGCTVTDMAMLIVAVAVF